MTLDELKTLLGIPLDDNSQDARLGILLAAALQFVELDLAQHLERFRDPGTNLIVLPALVKVGVAKLVESVDRDPGVKSESIGGMTQTFDTATASLIAQTYFNPFRRAFGFVPARSPFQAVDQDVLVLPPLPGGDLDGR